VITSTGGEDNPRCRLLMREGVHVDLHMWWGCSPDVRIEIINDEDVPSNDSADNYNKKFLSSLRSIFNMRMLL